MNKLMVIAGSAGSIPIVRDLLSSLPKKIDFSVLVLIHQKEQCGVSMANTLKNSTKLPVIDPLDGVSLLKGYVYVAPPLYHIQVEPDFTISYALDERVKFSRPSIDVLLETSAWVYQENLGVIILTGASSDGAYGAKKVLEFGGHVYVQDPKEAEFPIMPSSVLTACDLKETYTTIELKSLLSDWRN